MLLSTAEKGGCERRGALCEQEEHSDGSERYCWLNIVLESEEGEESEENGLIKEISRRKTDGD